MTICWWDNKMQTGCWYSLTGKTKVLLSSIKMNFEGNRAYLNYRSPSTIEITLSMKSLLTDQIHNHASKTLERLPRCSLWPCSQGGAPAWVPVISTLYWLLIPWSQSCGPIIVTWQPWYINLQSPSNWADPKVYNLSVRDSHSVGCIIDRSFRRQSFLPPYLETIWIQGYYFLCHLFTPWTISVPSSLFFVCDCEGVANEPPISPLLAF